jgi:hypothetical protein
VRGSAFINFFYFYCVDADFGPFFLKFSTYFPYTAKLYINGNEWAKRHGEPPRFRIPDPIRSGPERRTIYARTAQEVHT